jgi:hypothetical protein
MSLLNALGCAVAVLGVGYYNHLKQQLSSYPNKMKVDETECDHPTDVAIRPTTRV